MSGEHEDRRVRRTHRALREALRELMLQKAYDQITVQDVLDRADVGRATFYAHFRDKDALLLSEFEVMRDSLRRHLSTTLHAREHGSEPLRHGDHGPEVALALFEHAAERRGEYRALVRSKSGGAILKLVHQEFTSLMREHFDEAVAHARLQPAVPVEVTAQYVAGALLGVFTWWLYQDVAYSPDEMARMFTLLSVPAVAGSLGLDGR